MFVQLLWSEASSLITLCSNHTEMQKVKLIFIAALAFGAGLSAQSVQSLDAFDEVNVTGNIEVLLAVGDAEAASLETENIPEDEVTIKVSQGVLKIRVFDSVFYKDEQIKVFVTYRTLRAVRGNAGAIIRNRSIIEGEELLVRAGSGARVELRVAVDALDAGASEGGRLLLEGETERQEITASTGGIYDGLELACRRAYIKANTGGQADVTAEEVLDATANTGGRIRYRGEPEETRFKSVLSGTVEKMEN
mgnify:CR=1 FL=1